MGRPDGHAGGVASTGKVWRLSKCEAGGGRRSRCVVVGGWTAQLHATEKCGSAASECRCKDTFAP
eukprot:365660-Chlamydomonas_euryale.AAC.4